MSKRCHRPLASRYRGSPLWHMSVLAEENFEARYYAKQNKSSRKSSNKKDKRKQTGQSSYGPRGRSSKQRVPQQRMRQETRQAERRAKKEHLTEIYTPYWREQSMSSSESCSRQGSTSQIGTATRTAPYGRTLHADECNYERRTHVAMGASLGLPSAQELGLNTIMYSRLIQIASGAEIVPEDYDLLLLLDENNTRTTVQDISELVVLIVGDTDHAIEHNHDFGKVSNDDATDEKKSIRISRQSVGENTCCLICLQPFRDLEEGAKLCRLPCQHVFCHSCIEVWLRERSAKCPELSCFWKPTADGPLS